MLWKIYTLTQLKINYKLCFKKLEQPIKFNWNDYFSDSTIINIDICS